MRFEFCNTLLVSGRRDEIPVGLSQEHDRGGIADITLWYGARSVDRERDQLVAVMPED